MTCTVFDSLSCLHCAISNPTSDIARRRPVGMGEISSANSLILHVIARVVIGVLIFGMSNAVHVRENKVTVRDTYTNSVIVGRTNPEGD